MDPSENRVSDEGSNNCADDASNPQPPPHTVLLSKLFDLFFKALDEATNSDAEEGEKEKEEKGEEVGEGASTKVDPFADKVVEENEDALRDCTDVSEKEEKEKEDEAMKNNNEGDGGIEEEMEENESNEVNEVAPGRIILDIDLNKSPPHED